MKEIMFSSAFYRDLLKWLFSSIVISTEHGQSQETARKREEHIRFHLK